MEQDQKKLEHLKLIQIVIERMARNSFFIKGWAVTLISALYVFAKDVSNHTYLFIGLLPCFLFWYLDAFFLGQERLYRTFYDLVRNGEHLNAGEYDLTPHRTHPPEPVLRTMFRNTIWPFYLTIAATTLVSWVISRNGAIAGIVLSQNLRR